MVKMRRMGCLFLLLFGSACVFGQANPLYVKVKKENVRAEPNGTKIGEVLSGTAVTVVERRPNWVKVQLTGWVWEGSLTADATTVEGFKMRASHILVETEVEANRILAQLRQGADFGELARQYSVDRASGAKGGDVGTFTRGDFVPAFEEAVLQLKMEEVGGVVKTALGYHIIKRTG